MVRAHSPRVVFSSRRPRRRPSRLALIALGLLALGAASWLWLRRPLREVVGEVRARSHVQRVEGHAEVIRTAARESRVDPNLLAAIMLSESGGRVDAVSRADALGLFQLMLPTAVERAQRLRLPEPTREDLLSDALLNARLAASYVRWLEQRYDGNLEQMLIAYNAGPGRLGRWIREAGSYDAWRAEREAAGNSDVLRYAAKVKRFCAVFADRGAIAPAVDRPAVPAPSHEVHEPLIGPPSPDEHDPRTTFADGRAP